MSHDRTFSGRLAENFTIAGPTGSIYMVDANPELSPASEDTYRLQVEPRVDPVHVHCNDAERPGTSSADDFLYFGVPGGHQILVLSSESHWDPYIMGGVGFYMLSKASKSGEAVGLELTPG